MFKKTIQSDFFTTINIKIFFKTLSLLSIKLTKIKNWDEIKFCKKEFLSFLWLNNSQIISFYNWRTALYQLLKWLNLSKKDEIIVNGFTCVSVSNAVIQSWSKIIYSDIDKKNLSFDIKILEKNITKNTKVIIVQHTFWKPAEIEKIIKLWKKYNILIIEDCAHSLGSKKNKSKLWTFWDFSIFSTWRDKVISSVTWWFLIINNKKYFSLKNEIENSLLMPKNNLIIRNLMYNFISYFSYLFYDFFCLGKFIIFISRKFKIITEILTIQEKNCNYKDFYYKLPNSLSILIIQELQKINFYNNHRKLISNYYNDSIKNKSIKIIFKNLKTEKNNFFRFPILLKTEEEKENLYNYMKKNNVLLWKSWSWTNIVPIWTNLKKCKYVEWSCPISQNLAKRILTLPNHNFIEIKKAVKIVKLLNNFENKC